MLSANDLVQLPKGQGFALIQGGQLYKIRMPLPDGGDDPFMPVTLLRLTAPSTAGARRALHQWRYG
jgi:hypothetical protein